MNARRPLLTLALSLLGLVTLASFQQTPATASMPQVEQGKLAGTWSRPKPGMPGFAVGILADDGAPAYRIQLIVHRDPKAAVPSGALAGRVVLPGPVIVARVVGKWIDGPAGPGRFQGVLLTPDPSGSGESIVSGKIRGRFVDPPKAKGTFGGRWVILSS